MCDHGTCSLFCRSPLSVLIVCKCTFHRRFAFTSSHCTSNTQRWAKIKLKDWRLALRIVDYCGWRRDLRCSGIQSARCTYTYTGKYFLLVEAWFVDTNYPSHIRISSYLDRASVGRTPGSEPWLLAIAVYNIPWLRQPPVVTHPSRRERRYRYSQDTNQSRNMRGRTGSHRVSFHLIRETAVLRMHLALRA